MRELSLQQLQSECYRILVDFDNFCKSNGLRYSLYGGTLLGAIRHGGFIPWDDDLDVCMPRPDYERFLVLSENLSGQYSVATASNSALVPLFCKIQNRNIRAQEPMYRGVMDEYLWIDVFPMDGASPNESEHRRNALRFNRAMRGATWIRCCHPDSDSAIKKGIKKSYRLLYGRPGRVAKMQAAAEREVRKFDYVSSEYVSCITGCATTPWRVKREAFEKTTYMKFEDGTFPCMACADEYLRKIHGDYMQMPPEGERQTHSVEAWYVE